MKKRLVLPETRYDLTPFESECPSEYDEAFFTVAQGLVRLLSFRKRQEVLRGSFRLKHSSTDAEYGTRTDVRFDLDNGFLQRVEITEGANPINMPVISELREHEYVIFSDRRLRRAKGFPEMDALEYPYIDQQDVDVLKDAVFCKGGRTKLVIKQLVVDRNTQHFVSA